MDWTYLNNPSFAALVGIILGWLLSSFSAALRFRYDRRANMSLAVSQLLPAYFSLQALSATLESCKDFSETWTDYEDLRVTLWERHGDAFPSDERNDFREAIDRVARYKPLLAMRMRTLVQMFQKLSKIRLRATADKSQEAYLKLLSAQEVGRDALEAEIVKILRRLSWSASIWSGIQFELFYYRRGGGRKMRERNQDFISNLHMDVWNDVTNSDPAAKDSEPNNG